MHVSLGPVAYAKCICSWSHVTITPTLLWFHAVWALSMMDLLAPDLRSAFRKHLLQASTTPESLSFTARSQLLASEVLYQCRDGSLPSSCDLLQRLREDCVVSASVQHAAIVSLSATVKEEATAMRTCPSSLQVCLASPRRSCILF
jgi:hypothetical protein